MKPPIVWKRITGDTRRYPERKTYLYNQHDPLILFEHSGFSAKRLIQLRADIAAAVTKHASTQPSLSPKPKSKSSTPPPVEQPTFTIMRPILFGAVLRGSPDMDPVVRERLASTVSTSLAALSFPQLNPPQLKAVLRVLARTIEDARKAAEAAFVPGRRPKRVRPIPVPDLKLLGAVVEGKVFMAEGVQSIAELPTLDALRAQIVGLLSAPAMQLSMVLNEASGAKLSRTLEGFKKSLEPEAAEGEAPPS
ncbi:uncharacterized protein BXZ73DRAFT_101460 [Epithele typhae]|uniref:uncharacterized protein n=1 Tax=Epithele typhae TaxID=378194 RepID=UPI002008C77C|nr:uncharacterized protein BXZ73DRAFT_101460 [Epithele typhae]KAH9932083.1 hypothetical protein BXZ73DRAFT_101460 [Epithele typhae]